MNIHILWLAAVPFLLAACGSGEPEAPRQYSVQERLDQFAAGVRTRLAPKFKSAGVSYPPKKLAYLIFKDTNLLQVYARDSGKSRWKWVTEYPIQGASGTLGPKLRQGDLQVPEGLYRAEFLNANSLFHLSVRVNYPNAFDRKMAAADGRSRLGGDIMIHGSNVSIGCVAMGDPVAEDIFILAAHAGVGNIDIVISPTDFRGPSKAVLPTEPAWVKTLYASLRTKLKSFPLRADVK